MTKETFKTTEREPITILELYDMYNDYIDSRNGLIVIENGEFKASEIMEQMASFAYEAGLDSYYEYIRDEFLCATYEG